VAARESEAGARPAEHRTPRSRRPPRSERNVLPARRLHGPDRNDAERRDPSPEHRVAAGPPRRRHGDARRRLGHPRRRRRRPRAGSLAAALPARRGDGRGTAHARPRRRTADAAGGGLGLLPRLAGRRPRPPRRLRFPPLRAVHPGGRDHRRLAGGDDPAVLRGDPPQRDRRRGDRARGGVDRGDGLLRRRRRPPLARAPPLGPLPSDPRSATGASGCSSCRRPSGSSSSPFSPSSTPSRPPATPTATAASAASSAGTTTPASSPPRTCGKG
jgi:hypothetical protein